MNEVPSLLTQALHSHRSRKLSVVRISGTPRQTSHGLAIQTCTVTELGRLAVSTLKYGGLVLRPSFNLYVTSPSFSPEAGSNRYRPQKRAE